MSHQPAPWFASGSRFASCVETHVRRQAKFVVSLAASLVFGCGLGAVPLGADEPPLANLGTRDQGIDWPDFLGPDRDSRSPETGILTRWNQDGLRIVWQKELGESYGIGAVAKGRYFQFDRVGPEARLRCLHAETGESLWEFRYPTRDRKSVV